MSEQKTRTVETIQQEYQSGCLKLGHLEYQVYTIKKDIDVLKSQLRDMNFEAAQIQAKASEEAAKAAEAVAKFKAEQEANNTQNAPKLEVVKND